MKLPKLYELLYATSLRISLSIGNGDSVMCVYLFYIAGSYCGSDTQDMKKRIQLH